MQLGAIFNGGILDLFQTLFSCVLLVLIIIKHQYAKIGMYIWTISFVILLYAYELGIYLINDIIEDFNYSKIWPYLAYAGALIVGVVILKYTNRTVQIINVEDSEQALAE